MQPWSRPLQGRIEEHVVVSEALRGNPLGDPHERPLWVYLPPAYDDEPERRYPTLYQIDLVSSRPHTQQYSSLALGMAHRAHFALEGCSRATRSANQRSQVSHRINHHVGLRLLHRADRLSGAYQYTNQAKSPRRRQIAAGVVTDHR